MSSNSLDFYKNLPVFSEFSDMAQPQHYRPAPDDWAIVITDVVGSTQAIEAGRHKDVNVAGIMTIIALTNMCKGFEFPFVFGGDGATFLLPETMLASAQDVLVEARQRCQSMFDLALRVGVVPVRELYAANLELRVAKLKVSEIYSQALLSGSGMEYAERLVKDEALNTAYLLPKEYEPKKSASYVGLFCPFQDIRNAKEEMVSLILKVVSADSMQAERLLTNIIQQMDEILGKEGTYHPLSDELHVQWATTQQTQQLVMLNARTDRGLKPKLFQLVHKFVRFVTRLQLSGLGKDADFRKFDGSLKLVAACSKASRLQLESFLEELRAEGQIFYGLHVSEKALVTCLMDLHGRRVPIHFVDGADGGYTFAARQLKEQMAAQGKI